MNSELLKLVISSIKRGDDNQAVSTTRKNENNIAELAQGTKDKLVSLFNTTGMRVGRFDTTPERPLFARTLDKHLNTETLTVNEFRKFGERLGNSLASELNRGQAQNAKDGFLLIYYYSIDIESLEEPEEPDKDYYLGLVFLHRMHGVDIDVDELDLKEIEQINLDSLNLGARISISRFINEEDETEKPISFKIGRGSDVRKFFQDFIGCTEPSDSKTDSANLLIALEDVCGRLKFSAEETKLATEKLQTYCNARMQHGGGQAEIENLAGFIFDNSQQKEFFVGIAQEEYQLSEYIGLDKSEINKFDDILVKTDSYRVMIKDSAMNEAVFWDAGEQSIKLCNLPPETIRKMNRRYPEAN